VNNRSEGTWVLAACQRFLAMIIACRVYLRSKLLALLRGGAMGISLHSNSMDTISRENNNPSILPVVGAILGGLGLVLGIVASVKVGPIKKLSSEVESLTNQVQSVGGEISSVRDTANRANNSVTNLASQTQRGFDAVTAEIGNLRTDVNKLATAKVNPAPAKGPKAPADGSAAPAGAPAGPGGEYTIKGGDTFAKIAKANGTTISALQAANPGVNSGKLKVGQKINLPAR
jgi:LysM repeat protein